ncbi:fimbria biosynthesis regulator FimY [Kosakonia oryzae]|uniref:fimbria biosynthesis regulator FimY n=1 Tax=Kosakonia oryzae TaxID=497725 RepID=UPI001D0749B7|nr:DNA-binding response regulator [Kosakonia oryzae]
MRTVIRREKNRRHQADHTVLPNRERTPQVFDKLEHLSQQLNFTLPECVISQLLISTDGFLVYAWCRCLFSVKRSAVFPSLESALHRLEDRALSRLIVDMESLTTSRFSALETLRQLAQSHPDLHIYLLAAGHDPALLNFLRACGPFHILRRDLPIAPFRQALLTPPDPHNASPPFQPAQWRLICTLAQGESLKCAARQLNLPYHRVAYRLARCLAQLGLPDRQSFLHLLHRLTLDANR